MNPRPALFALALLALPALAAAQEPVNPSSVRFDSPDHAAVTRYVVGYFIGDAAEPFQQASVPVAAVGGTGLVNRTALLSRPAFGRFTLKMKAVGLDVTGATGAEVQSPWSGPSVPFVFSPLAPTVRGLP